MLGSGETAPPVRENARRILSLCCIKLRKNGGIRENSGEVVFGAVASCTSKMTLLKKGMPVLADRGMLPPSAPDMEPKEGNYTPQSSQNFT